MPIPENPLELPEEEQIKYLDSLKGHRNRVIEFDFILRLKKPGQYSGFVECIRSVWPETDYAGLHATDPNWYEFGRYQTGILEPYLLQNFEDFLRMIRRLKDDQTLKALCCFTEAPQGDGSFRDGWGDFDTKRRADLMIAVEGGLFDHWGQYMNIDLVEGTEPFDLDRNAGLIEEIKNKAKAVGKQEMTYEEWKQDWIESGKRNKEKDEAIDRYFAEGSARWAAESEEN